MATNVTFLYLGRRGMSRFVRGVTEAASSDAAIRSTMVVSRQSDAFAILRNAGIGIVAVDTFDRSSGALTRAWRVPGLRRAIATHLAGDHTDVVIDLMPHVWSPFVASAAKRARVPYVTIVHDARPHPGDRTAVVRPMVVRAIRRAQHAIALSHSVAAQIAADGLLPAERVSVAFHPDLDFCGVLPAVSRRRHDPVRLLFLGRLAPYKGLGLFIDAVRALQTEGIRVQPGVFGEGSLGRYKSSLDAMGAEIANRWLSDDDIGEALSRYDVLIATHFEASQSGAVAAALGAGVPCVVTPVGGLCDQIDEGATGAVATELSANAVAAAVLRVISEGRYERICENIMLRKEERSMTRFLSLCLAAVSRDQSSMSTRKEE